MSIEGQCAVCGFGPEQPAACAPYHRSSVVPAPSLEAIRDEIASEAEGYYNSALAVRYEEEGKENVRLGFLQASRPRHSSATKNARALEDMETLALVGCGVGDCLRKKLCERCDLTLLRMATQALAGTYPKDGYHIFGGYERGVKS